MSKLEEVISKMAPVLGSVIPLPGASIIGNFIGAMFDGDFNNPDELASKILLDPSAREKLLELQENVKVQLAQIAATQAQATIAADIAMLQADVADRTSARSMMTSSKVHVQSIITFFLTLGMSGLIWFLCAHGLPDEKSTTILMMLIGSLITSWTQAMNFFFGSSSSSTKKDEMLFNSTPLNNNVTK